MSNLSLGLTISFSLLQLLVGYCQGKYSSISFIFYFIVANVCQFFHMSLYQE